MMGWARTFHTLRAAPSPRLRGEGAFPQAQTRGDAPSPGAQERADLSPQAGRGDGSGELRFLSPQEGGEKRRRVVEMQP
jgi:hypothetical protein